jgi:hypothetical protein
VLPRVPFPTTTSQGDQIMSDTALQPQGPIPGPGDLISSSIEVFKTNLVPYAVGGFAMTILTFLGPLALANLVIGPGLFIMALRGVAGKPVELGHLGAAMKRLVPILLTFFLMGLAVSIGSMILLLPGIAAALFLQYAPELCIDREMEFMDAFKASANIVKQDIVNHFILLIVVGILGFIGGIPLASARRWA